MIFSDEAMVQLLIGVLPLAVVWGGVTTRLKSLEDKMDRHNNLVERMVAVEQSVKSAHRRLDELHDHNE